MKVLLWATERTGAEPVQREFETSVIRIGRAGDNDLVLADGERQVASRHHAELRSVDGAWRMRDLGSTNGTFVNGQRTADAPVYDGDEIQFGARGPRLRVVLPERRRPPAADPTPSELVPLRMGLHPLRARGYLVPGLITAGAFSSFLFALNRNDLSLALIVILSYFALASTTVLYQVCGKRASWLALVASAVLTAVVVQSAHPLVIAPIRAIVGDALAKPDPAAGIVPQFLHAVFFAAVPEEFEKLLPALLGLWLYTARRVGKKTPLHGQFEVTEPLDGILLGVAAGAGFTVVEAYLYAWAPYGQFSGSLGTVTQLLRINPDIIAKALAGAFDQGATVFAQAIFRGIFEVFGHQAYAGISGYYVGLAALRPEHRTSLVLRGYLTAIALHALWNTTVGIPGMLFLLPPISFAVLMTSIVKARQLSPARDENFATTLWSVLGKNAG